MISHVAWSQLEPSDPELAEMGRRLLYQGSNTASAFLATVAPGGCPELIAGCHQVHL